MDINAVEQRTADFSEIALNDARRAAAFAGVIAIEPARVRLQILVAVAKLGW